jgi:hypothetical protein
VNCITLCQSGETSEAGSDRVAKLDPACLPRERDETAPSRPRRVLFLDDDPLRAELFLGENPHAVWVKTAAECLEHLKESWEEVHLDHDLGGERLVDMSQHECGMEVIRWLSREPRTHLRETFFFVHTHNLAAGLMMVLRMHEGGYKAEFRPFGVDLAETLARNEPGAGPSAVSVASMSEAPAEPAGAPKRWLGWIGALWRRRGPPRSGTNRDTT